MTGKVPVEELPQDVREKLGIKMPGEGKQARPVRAQVVILGEVLLALKGLTNRQALWVLRTASVLVRGYREDKKPSPRATVAGRKGKIVGERQ